MDQVVLDSGKKSYFAFVEEAILVNGRDFSVFLIGNVCLRGQFLINLICRDSASILRVELLA